MRDPRIPPHKNHRVLLAAIRRFLTVPTIEPADAEARQRARLLLYMLVMLIFSGILILLVEAVLNPGALDDFDYWLTAVFCVVGVFLHQLARRGHTGTAAALLIALLFGLATIAPFAPDSLSSLPFYVTIPLLVTTLFFSARWTFRLTLLAVAVPAVLLLFTGAAQRGEWHRTIESILFVLPVGGLLLVFVKYQAALERIHHAELQTAYERAHASERLLEQHVQQRTDALHVSEQARLLSESRYHHLFEQSHDAVFILDLEGKHIEVNQHAAEMLGYSAAEIRQLTFRDLSAEVEKSEHIRERMLAGEHIPLFERRFRRKDGSQIIVEINVELVSDADGKPLHIQSVVRDISERKQAEAFQRAFLEDMRALQHLHLELSQIEDLDTLYRQMVLLTKQRLGVERFALFLLDQAQQTLFGTYGVDQHGSLRAEHYYNEPVTAGHWTNAVLNAPEHVRFWETAPIYDDGAVIGTGWKVAAAVWNGQHALGYLVADNYVSGKPARPYETELLALLGSTYGHLIERKRSETALRDREINFRTLFDTIKDFLFVLDIEGRILEVNQTVLRRLGYSFEELVNQPVLMVHPPARRAEAARIVAEMLQGLLDYCPVPIQTRDGQLIPVETYITRGLWNGQPALFGVSKDLSDLKISEEKFALAFHANPAIAGLSDIETGEYIEVNRTFYEKLGFTPDEVIGKTAMEVLGMDGEFREQVVGRLRNQGTVHNAETVIYTRDGTPLSVLMSAEILTLNNIPCNFTTAVDITERKRAEEALRRSEERQRAMLRAIPDLMFRIGVDGTYLDYHTPDPRLLAVPPEMFLGKSVEEVLPASIARQHMAAIAQVTRTGHSARLEYELVLAGVTHHFEGRIVPVSKDEVLAIVRDMTELWQTQQALKTANAQLESSVEAARIAWWEMDVCTQRLSFDGRRMAMAGYDPADFAEASFARFAALVHPEDYTPMMQSVQELLDGRRSVYAVDYRLQKAHGGWLWLHDRGERTLTPDGRAVLRGFVMDITERKQAQQHEFDLALEKERVRLLRSFIEKASHEFRTPLAVVNSAAFLMARLDDAERRQVKATAIEEQVSRITRLVEMLLLLSQLESGAQLDLSPVDLGLLLDKVCQNIVNLYAGSPSLQWAVMPDLPLLVLGSPEYLEAAFWQVLDNACRFTPQGGRISALVTVEDRSVWFEVQDSGPGIAEQDLPHIFDTFWRRDEAHSTPGLGLGLPIARKIIERHGGSIQVESVVGSGTKVRVCMPLNGHVLHNRTAAIPPH